MTPRKASTQLICTKCGWVHMGVSVEFAEAAVKQFNEYFDTLPKDKQEAYYGGKKSHLAEYCFCGLCGSLFTRMRKPTKKDKLPYGSTLNPIIDPKQAKYGTKK